MIRNGNMDVVNQFSRASSAVALAAQAIALGKNTGIDQGHLILSYAKLHDDWMRANQALNFIEQRVDAVALVKEKFIANVDLDSISNESAQHLLTMQGFQG